MSENSFKKSGESNPLAPELSDADSAAKIRMDMLGGDIGDGETEIIDAPPRQRVPGYIVFLCLLVVAAGAVLFGMRKIGLAPTASAGEIRIEPPVATGNLTADHGRVLSQLSIDDSIGQVPIEQVQRNPFMLAESLKPVLEETAEVPTSVAGTPVREDPELVLRRELTAKFKTLKVNGVLGGSNPVARINGKTYRLGDMVLDTFIVTEIDGRSVQLSHDGKPYDTLEMGVDGKEDTKLSTHGG